MKALVKFQSGVGHVEIRDAPEPVPTDHQVKLEVAWCGICGTDLHVYHDLFRNYPPVILGHEFCGRAVEVGPNVKNIREGERFTVLGASTVTCGQCVYCRRGELMCLELLVAQGIKMQWVENWLRISRGRFRQTFRLSHNESDWT